MANTTLKRVFGTPWIIPPAVGALVAIALDPPPIVKAILFGVPLLVCAVPLYRYVLAQQLARAARVGLTYSRRDPFKMVSTIDMPLFSRAAPRVHDVFHGERGGTPVRVFHFDYGGEGGVESLCAMTAVPADWPGLVVSGERFDRDEQKRARVSEVELELAEFGDRYRVYSRDAYFATAFVDQRLMAWLMTMPNGWGIETAGGWLMCHVPKDSMRYEDREPEPLLALLDRVLEHVPKAAYSLFPRTAAD